MLENFSLTNSLAHLAGAISPNIIAINCNRGSCEAKMAKLLLKYVSQGRIGVTETDEAKDQFSKVTNYLAIAEVEKFLNFNKFTD